MLPKPRDVKRLPVGPLHFISDVLNLVLKISLYPDDAMFTSYPFAPQRHREQRLDPRMLVLAVYPLIIGRLFFAGVFSIATCHKISWFNLHLLIFLA